jgi:hypothetical protein
MTKVKIPNAYRLDDSGDELRIVDCLHSAAWCGRTMSLGRPDHIRNRPQVCGLTVRSSNTQDQGQP